MSKHDIMKAYLEPQALSVASSALNFNASIGTPDSIAFITEYANKIIKKYFHGAVKEYGFAIIITTSYSDGTDDLNLLAMNMAQGFGDWVESQNKSKIYPNFGAKCKMQKIESLQNMPNLAEISPETATARYMLQCKLTYYEED